MRQQLGKMGEKAAEEYLLGLGYVILHKNYRTTYGELDIIAKHHNILIFVEVKTRSNTEFGYPEEAITPKKISHIKKAAMAYLSIEKTKFKELRFDVIGILRPDEKTYQINHTTEAF